MNVAVIGTGYVGLVTGACFAETGNQVACMDIDSDKIDSLKEGEVPIFEPGLEELLARNQKEGRLSFTTNLEEAVKTSEAIFVTVGTPSGEDGFPDLTAVENVCRDIARARTEPTIIVIKSTVPVGTADYVREQVRDVSDVPFQIVSNPEFLKEGAAIDDFMKPDRVVIGASDEQALETIADLYSPFVLRGAPVLRMDSRSAEMVKYASNAMLACRISFMNEVANLCERVGADVHRVRTGMGLDERIGPGFLYPGVGYGGSCFPKDVRGLVGLGNRAGCEMRLAREIDQVNLNQAEHFVEKIVRFFQSGLASELEERIRVGQPVTAELSNSRQLWNGDPVTSIGASLEGRRVAVWGLSFKPRTDDMREAPSTRIVPRLIEAGARLFLYDPEALGAAWKLFADTVEYATSSFEALEKADALVLLTEWPLFRHPDFEKMRKMMKLPVIFDGRNQYPRSELIRRGFVYFGVGV